MDCIVPLVVQLRYWIAHLPTVAHLRKARNHSMHTEYNLMSIGPMYSFNVRLRAMVIAGLTGLRPCLAPCTNQNVCVTIAHLCLITWAEIKGDSNKTVRLGLPRGVSCYRLSALVSEIG